MFNFFSFFFFVHNIFLDFSQVQRICGCKAFAQFTKPLANVSPLLTKFLLRHFFHITKTCTSSKSIMRQLCLAKVYGTIKHMYSILVILTHRNDINHLDLSTNCSNNCKIQSMFKGNFKIRLYVAGTHLMPDRKLNSKFFRNIFTLFGQMIT